VTFDVGNGITFKVVETLGHASHHVSYYEPLSYGVFTGDAAGIYLPEIDVIVPTTPPPFHLNVALESLDKLVRLKPKVLYYSHFGKAEDAMEKLQAYVQQIKLWERIAKEGVQRGEDLEAVRKRIIENDEGVKKASKYLITHKVLSETTLRESIQGFIDFVKKEKESQK